MYKIIRCFFNTSRRPTIKKGITIEQAWEHCRDPETSSSTCTKPEGKRRTRKYGPWFDSYTKE